MLTRFLPFPVFLIVSICFSAIAAGQTETETPAAPAPVETPAPVKNEFLKRLEKRRTFLESFLEKDKKKAAGNSADQIYRDGIKRLDIQIELAKKAIADGNEFGEKEYKAAQKILSRQDRDAAARSRLDAADERRKIRDKHLDEVEAAQKKYLDEVDSANQELLAKLESQVLLQQFKLNPGKLGIIVWNLPLDKELHNRFTSTIEIRLLNEDKIVWKKRKIKLSRKSAENRIKIPDVLFNKVAIDIVAWKGDGGGLAEVEVFAGHTNLATQRPCEVTNSETLPVHMDDQHSLTDGVKEPTENGEGYWITEEKKKATLTINLLGPLVVPEK